MTANDNKPTMEVTVVWGDDPMGAASATRCLTARVRFTDDGCVYLEPLTPQGTARLELSPGDTVYFE